MLLEDVPLARRVDMYFQQDGAPPHYSWLVTEHLNLTFPGRWIGRGGPINWPARSPDLTLLDYGIWGWMNIVYERKVNTRDELIVRTLAADERIKYQLDKLKKQHATFAFELQNSLRSVVGYLKIYCKLKI